jgi:L-alanine-DL-glutamate epimerase-like enolase superfamily enzyme
MKIIQLEGYTVSPNEQQLYRYTGQDPLTSRAFEVIRLVLEDGSEGVAGSSTGWFGAQRGLVTDQIEDLATRVLGRDVATRTDITRQLILECDSVVPQAESLLDIAMWDAWGKSTGNAIWECLGGYQSCIPAYASTQAFLNIDEYIDITRKAIALGYPAIKYHMNCDLDFDLEMVAAIHREFSDSGIRFMVDLEQRYDLDQSIRLGELLSTLPYDWMEAPLDDTDLDAYVELNKRVDIDILPAGNTLIGIEHWRNALSMGAWSRLRCDANNSGGITIMIDAMELANQRGVPLEIQSFGFTTNQAPNLQLMLGLPGCNWFEQPFPPQSFEFGAVNPIHTDSQGLVCASVGHGIGLEMDWQVI